MNSSPSNTSILVTGAAGFIGFHLSQKLLDLGYTVIGLDNINDYYSVSLKKDRLEALGIVNILENKLVTGTIYGEQFSFIKLDLSDRKALPEFFAKTKIDKVCNLAAQAGVRYSIENPMAYADNNIIGFLNLLECIRHNDIRELVYASSSSVYGNNKDVPFSVEDNVDHPVSLYAATKKSNELMAHTYSHLYGINTIGLRFFTVYGPWGRPDMAMFLFTDAILKNKPIKVFNHGELHRDFTFIDDIIDGLVSTLTVENKAKYRIYNIGNGSPVKLTSFIEEIEATTGKKAQMEMYPMQPGDVSQTFADTKGLEKDFNYKPKTNIKEGVSKFVDWYNAYYSHS